MSAAVCDPVDPHVPNPVPWPAVTDEPRDATVKSDGGPGWGEAFMKDVRATGREPDARFSLANERTFLAWIRTSLALVGGGLAVEKLAPDLAGNTRLALLLMALGLGLSVASYRRWVLVELALRTDSPLPASRQPLLLMVGVIFAGVVAVALVLVSAS
jgi:putative membrane protein